MATPTPEDSTPFLAQFRYELSLLKRSTCAPFHTHKYVLNVKRWCFVAVVAEKHAHTVPARCEGGGSGRLRRQPHRPRQCPISYATRLYILTPKRRALAPSSDLVSGSIAPPTCCLGPLDAHQPRDARSPGGQEPRRARSPVGLPKAALDRRLRQRRSRRRRRRRGGGRHARRLPPHHGGRPAAQRPRHGRARRCDDAARARTCHARSPGPRAPASERQQAHGRGRWSRMCDTPCSVGTQGGSAQLGASTRSTNVRRT